MFLAAVVLIVSIVYNKVDNTEMLLVDKITILPFAFTSVMGGIMIISFSHSFYNISFINEKIKNFICYIGDHTMIILALHYPLIVLYKYYNFWESSIIEILIGVFIPLVILAILNSAKTQSMLVFNFLYKNKK